MKNQTLLGKLIVHFLPLLLLSIYSGYIFSEKGLPAGTDHWRFYASLTGFVFLLLLLVASLIMFIKKHKINFHSLLKSQKNCD